MASSSSQLSRRNNQKEGSGLPARPRPDGRRRGGGAANCLFHSDLGERDPSEMVPNEGVGVGGGGGERGNNG